MPKKQTAEKQTAEKQTASNGNIQVVKKLSPSAIITGIIRGFRDEKITGIGDLVKKEGESMPLYRIGGYIRKVEVVSTTYGESLAYHGEVSLIPSAELLRDQPLIVYSSRVMYVNELFDANFLAHFNDDLTEVLDGKKKDNVIKTLSFGNVDFKAAASIGIRNHPSAAKGYEYTMEFNSGDKKPALPASAQFLLGHKG